MKSSAGSRQLVQPLEGGSSAGDEDLTWDYPSKSEFKSETGSAFDEVMTKWSAHEGDEKSEPDS